MQMTFRWYGEGNDSITPAHIKQIPGVSGLVWALHDKMPGEVWEVEEIAAVKKQLEPYGFNMDVVESVNVHDDIKIGLPTRDKYIENYKQTLKNLAQFGVKVVTYNFMPIFDWTRSDLFHPVGDGSTALFYEKGMIQDDYNAMAEYILGFTEKYNMTFPGWEPERMAKLDELFRAYAEGNSVAEFHGWRNDAMTMVNRTALSSTMAALNRGSIVTGALSADTPAVFVTGVDEKGVAVTDILVCREDGSMTNAALNSSTGVSGLIFSYRQLQPQDINGDGIIEVPAPAAHSEHEKMNDGIVDWLQCDMDGETQRVSTTYHCLSSGWYFAIPEDWVGSVSASSSESGLSESQVLLQVDGQPVTALYAISGENRENRALRGNRMVLRRQTAIVYAGELLEGSAALEFDEDALRENFRLIVSSWTS